MAQEKSENSVLFSLRELRDIEQTRVRSEEEQRLHNQEAERRRIEDERRRVEDERRRREEEERMQFEQLERQRREEDLRLQEAERRARIEAETSLEQQRLAHEMELRRHEISKKRPTWLLAVVGVLVVLGGGLGVWGYQTYQERQAAQAQAQASAKALAELEQQRIALEAEIGNLNQQIGDAQAKLATASTAEERAAAQQELANLNAEAKKKRDRKKQVDSKSSEVKTGGRKIEMTEACRKNPLDC
jgi:cell division protein FtsB